MGCCVNFIKFVPNADKGREGVRKFEKFADVISGFSHTYILRGRTHAHARALEMFTKKCAGIS